MSVFFFQAEDGIRDVAVTGVQTCALPISMRVRPITLETFYTTGGGIEKQSLCGNNQHVWIPPSRWHGGISVSVISTPWEMRTWRAQILTKQSRQPPRMRAFSTSGTSYGNGSRGHHNDG